MSALGAGIEFLTSYANFYLLRFTDGRHTAEGAARHSSDTASSRGRLPPAAPHDCLRITVGLSHENDAVLGVLADYMTD